MEEVETVAAVAVIVAVAEVEVAAAYTFVAVEHLRAEHSETGTGELIATSPGSHRSSDLGLGSEGEGVASAAITQPKKRNLGSRDCPVANAKNWRGVDEEAGAANVDFAAPRWAAVGRERNDAMTQYAGELAATVATGPAKKGSALVRSSFGLSAPYLA